MARCAQGAGLHTNNPVALDLRMLNKPGCGRKFCEALDREIGHPWENRGQSVTNWEFQPSAAFDSHGRIAEVGCQFPTNRWNLAYTLQTGLGLGEPYTIRDDPTGTNVATGLAWAPARDGLRNITGSVGPDGFVRIRAITSTISGNGDRVADPNRLAVVFDSLSNTDPAVAVEESFFTLRQAEFGEVLRGVSFTPGTDSHGR
jgi:hypothetical protein